MPRIPLRSVPTGSGVSTGGLEDGRRHETVDIGSDSMDADLDPTVIGSTAPVVAASLLDFLR